MHNLKIFKEERCRLNIRKKSFIYRSTDVWNSLPQSVVDAPSVQSFEVRSAKLWKNHPIIFFYCTTSTMDCVTFRRMRTASKQCSRQSWHKRQECLILARKGPVRIIIQKHAIIATVNIIISSI